MRHVTLYHNPRCSNSRQTLALLQKHNIEPEIILYLDNPPTEVQLTEILVKLAISPRQLLRQGEAEYKTHHLHDECLSDAELIVAMVKCPKLIERPIVIMGDQAKIGRPPENILELLR